jgi:hypothetical protein
LNKFDYTYHQFLLRFDITNLSTNANAKVMPGPLLISRVSLLKNSNTLGTDIYDYDIMMFNLHKITNEYNTKNYNIIGMSETTDKKISGFDYSPLGTVNHLIELPICLNRSYLCSSLIKDQIVIRVFFKGNVAYDGI